MGEIIDGVDQKYGDRRQYVTDEEPSEVIIDGVDTLLGPELVTGTDSDMSGANNWTGATLAGGNVTIGGGKMKMLGDGGAYDIAGLPEDIVIAGKRYRMSVKARRSAGASVTIRVGNDLEDSDSYFEITPTGTEATYKGDIAGTLGTSISIGVVGPGMDGIEFEIDDVSVREML